MAARHSASFRSLRCQNKRSNSFSSLKPANEAVCPTALASAIATREFPSENSAIFRTSTLDILGNCSMTIFSTRSMEPFSKRNTCVSHGVSFRISYSTVSRLTWVPEGALPSCSTSSLCHLGSQLSMIRTAGLLLDISLPSTTAGEGIVSRPTSAYTANTGSRASEPTSSSNNAWTNRVLPTPERPTRRTGFPSSSPARSIPLRRTSLTRSIPSIRLNVRSRSRGSMNRAFSSGKKCGYFPSGIRFEVAHCP
mgnify:CR=1 FL=1